MPKPPVLNKKDFVKRFLANEFGNRGPTWNSLEDFKNANYSGLVHLRNRVAGGDTFYDLKPLQALEKWQEVEDQSRWYCAAMAPTEKTLFQGEVKEGIWGLDLFYTTVAKPMRDALKEWSKSVSGILAYSLLRQFLCPNSYDWLMHLLAEYPDHVVEFSTFSVQWGTVPGYNTVYWEVRLY